MMVTLRLGNERITVTGEVVRTARLQTQAMLAPIVTHAMQSGLPYSPTLATTIALAIIEATGAKIVESTERSHWPPGVY